MLRPAPAFALAGTLALGACAVAPPTGPSVVALPGQGKSFAAFQEDDAVCRNYAAAQTNYASPAQAATQSAVGSAAIGTVLGAAAGAALGAAAGNAGAGAAIGAGSGLLLGGATGAGNAQASGATLQRRYDISYAQCMYAKGNTVQMPPIMAGPYPYGPYGPYAPYPAYYGPVYPGSVAIGVGGGWR